MFHLRHRQVRRSASCLAAALSFVVIGIPIRVADAATDSWTGTTGKWETGTNWSAGAKPGTTDDAVIGNNGTANYDSTTGSNTISTLALGKSNPSGGTGTLNISGGSLSITNNLTIAAGSSMAGSLSLTAGSLTVGGNIVDGGNGTSTFTLNGGTLDMTSGGITVDTLSLQSGVTERKRFRGRWECWHRCSRQNNFGN